MVMISMAGEVRTPSYHTMGSPRYGGCVSAFFQFFDWNPGKRFSSTKRLPTSKPEKAVRRSRSLRSDHGLAPNTPMLQICDADADSHGDAATEESTTMSDYAPSIPNSDASTRAPGVVARLMGLESLPDDPYHQPPRHRRCQTYAGGEPFAYRDADHGSPTPVLLQDLLKRDFKTSKRTLRDRIPGFAKRAQEQYESRFTKKGAALAALRCRQLEDGASQYIDIPDVRSRFLCALAQRKRDDGKQPFLSRLPASSSSSSQCAIPLLPSKLHIPREINPSSTTLEGIGNHIQELGLQQQAGWPLLGHQRLRDIDREIVESEGSSKCAPSKSVIMSNGTRLLQGRRRGSSWNGSEDNESANEHVDDFRASFPVRNFYRKPRVGREALKRASSERLLHSLSPPCRRNSRKSVREFKTSGPRRSVPPKVHIRTSSARKSSVILSSQDADTMLDSCQADRQRLIQATSRSTDSQSPEPVESAHENARTSSACHETLPASQSSNLTANAEIPIRSKTSGITAPRGGEVPKTGRTGRSGSKVTRNSHMKSDGEQREGVSVASSRNLSYRSATALHRKPPPLDGFLAASRANPPKSSGSLLGYGRLLGKRKEGDKPVAGMNESGDQIANLRGSSHGRGSTTVRITEEADGIANSTRSAKNTLQGIQRVRQKMLANTVSSATQQPPVHALIGDRLKRGNLEEMATQSSATRIHVIADDESSHRQARAAWSVDDVFPEVQALDFDSIASTSYVCETDAPILEEPETDGQNLTASLSRSLERMFGQRLLSIDGKRNPDHADISDCSNGDEAAVGGESGVVRNYPVVGRDEVRCLGASAPRYAEAEILTEQEVFHINLQEFFAAGPDDLLWDDMVVEHDASSSLNGRYCERSCSGPSISSVSVASDADDGRNGDAWSSCASYNPADCDSPRTFELPETDAESDLQEIKSASVFMKKISEGSHGTARMEADEAGQPSPVSILNSPFHDEACTTSESSLSESLRQFQSDEDGYRSPLRPRDSTTLSRLCAIESSSSLEIAMNYTDNEKIRQALLDLSMFQSLEAFTFEYKERAPSSPEEEQGFVREILSAAHFLSVTPGSSPNWFDQDLAIDPSLFDRLESGDIDNYSSGVEKLFQISGGLWRCDRKLLFDCVNEAFATTSWRYKAPGRWLQELVGSDRPRGQRLVEEVYKKIEEWRTLASHAVDVLIEKDMGIHFDNWKDFSAEVADLGLVVENILWKAIVEEAVTDILSISKRKF